MNTTQQDLERTLAYHGAPALAGIKSADLVAWGSPEVCAGAFFQQYRRQLAAVYTRRLMERLTGRRVSKG